MFSFLPPATRAIIVANVVMYVIELLFPNQVIGRLALWPLGSPLFQPWQLITYGFLHALDDIKHILFNMFALYMFGRGLEDLWGPRRFLAYYFAALLAAGLTQIVVSSFSANSGYVVGASGGVFGILLAFALYFPHQRLILLFPPIPMPAWLFVTLYGLIELGLGVFNKQMGVAHFAHLGGMLGGALVILYWRMTGREQRRA
jgi:membrane associated rhomboid family serine protease